MIGGAFNVLPDVALDCTEEVLAFRLSAARIVLEFKSKGLGLV